MLFGAVTGGLIKANTGTVYETRASMSVTVRRADGSYPNGTATPSRDDVPSGEHVLEGIEEIVKYEKLPDKADAWTKAGVNEAVKSVKKRSQ